MKLGFISLFLIFLGCKTSYDTITTRIPVSAPVPFGTNRAAGAIKWAEGYFPLTLRLDSNLVSYYDSGNEAGHGPQVMATKWDNALAGKVLFNYDFEDTITPAQSNVEDYDDGELGIYGIEDWFSDVSSNALAITQYFAVRRNPGTSNEYLEIIHADILVNLDFLFSDDGSRNKYDLSSILLHELGHFLGLGHYFGRENSVMDPYIHLGEVKRSLFSTDLQAIRDNYPTMINPSSTGVTATRSIPAEGEEIVRGIIEQRAGGNCVHHKHY